MAIFDPKEWSLTFRGAPTVPAPAMSIVRVTPQSRSRFEADLLAALNAHPEIEPGSAVVHWTEEGEPSYTARRRGAGIADAEIVGTVEV